MIIVYLSEASYFFFFFFLSFPLFFSTLGKLWRLTDDKKLFCTNLHILEVTTSDSQEFQKEKEMLAVLLYMFSPAAKTETPKKGLTVNLVGHLRVQIRTKARHSELLELIEES